MGKVADAALYARDLVAEKWFQGTPDAPTHVVVEEWRRIAVEGIHCASTAENAAEAALELTIAESMDLWDVRREVQAEFGIGPWLPEWNDAAERTQDEVVAFWDAVAKVAKDRGL